MSEPYGDRDAASRADMACTDDCREANDCYGHEECLHCGRLACGHSVTGGLCEECYESRKTCANCAEDFWDEGFPASDGEVCCSQDCLDDYESGLESGREPD